MKSQIDGLRSELEQALERPNKINSKGLKLFETVDLLILIVMLVMLMLGYDGSCEKKIRSMNIIFQ